MTAKRLGKGLSALIREKPEERADSDSIFEVSVDLIFPNPQQPRQSFNKKSLEELANSIREKGIIQPITVREKDGTYELIAGERRWRAAQLVSLDTVPVHVLDVEDDADMMVYALIENIQRENLNAIEEAEAYAILSGKHGLSHSSIAKGMGKSRVAVSNTLRLLRLPPEVKQSLRKDEISAGHGRALLGLSNTKQIIVVWKKITGKGLSVRMTEELVAGLNNIQKPDEQRKKKKGSKTPALVKIENDLVSVLGTNVTIKPQGKKGGVIEIKYYSNDDLDRLIDLFGEIE